MLEYNKTDQQLHYLSQLIAKVNRTYVPAKENDSHTNLYFDSLGNRISGHWVQLSDRKIIPTINLYNQTFEFLDSSLNVLKSVTTSSKRMTEIEKEIENLLPDIGLNPEGFTAELHYEITPYDFSDKPILSLNPDGFSLWKKYRELANQSCSLLLGFAQTNEEIRIWPHHFDTGIYFKAKNDMAVGFGLAMKDAMAGAPYFYLSAYPQGKDIEYINLPTGKWQWKLGDNWKGAILTLDLLEESSSKNMLNEYIKTVYQWIISQ